MSIVEQIDYETLTRGLPGSDRWQTAAARVDEATLKKALEQAAEPSLVDALRAELERRRTGEPITSLVVANHSGESSELVDDEPDEPAQEMALSEDEINRLKSSEAIGKRLGRKQMADVFQKLATVSQLLELQTIKETKSYKGLQIFSNGKLLTVSTFSQYCELVEGRSRSSIDNDLLNLKVLGADFVGSLQSIGIGAGTMRALRQLPPEERTELENAARDASREELMDIVEARFAKHEQEKAALSKKADDADTQLQASRARVERQRIRIEELEDAESARSLKAPDPDEETARLRGELGRFLLKQKYAISAAANSGIKALLDHGDPRGEDHREYVSGLLVEVEREVNILRDLFNIPKAPSATTAPEWARDLGDVFQAGEDAS